MAVVTGTEFSVSVRSVRGWLSRGVANCRPKYLLTYQAQATYLSCLHPEEAAATTSWDQMA